MNATSKSEGNPEFQTLTTAHRGQNVPFDPKLTTPGVGRADVWVFDADHLGATLSGTPITIVTLFADTPRALAVSPDGSKDARGGPMPRCHPFRITLDSRSSYR